MIDPSKPTNYNRSASDLEEWLLFCVVVAGKSSIQQAYKLDCFLKLEEGSAFEVIRKMLSKGTLLESLQKVKLGQYTRLNHVFSELVKYDVSKFTLSSLECIKGIGPKTARFYFLHSFPNLQLAVLDVHILSWLREQGYSAPKSTPNLKKYAELEQLFLKEAENRKLTPAELDIQIWNARKKVFNFQKSEI